MNNGMDTGSLTISSADALESDRPVEKTVSVPSEDSGFKVSGGKFYEFVKRSFDILSSFLLICLISWLLIIIFVVQLFFTHGHPIFCDSRIGKNGKEIKVFKFRSMFYDAESNIDKYLSPEQKEIWIRERKLDDDPRITKFGKILRKTSLDELPQLFNILFGTMSVVGYRPMSEREYYDHFTEKQRRILASARPGLTGYWQVYGRSDVDFESGKRQKMELKYFEKRSLLFDLRLIFLTIPAVLKEKGAK